VALGIHLTAAVLMQGIATAIIFMLPILAKKEFAATDWQVAILTAAPTIMFVVSIFWNEALQRITLARFSLVYWAAACLPLGLIGALYYTPLRGQLWPLVVLQIIASIGGAGWPALNGELLKRVYSDSNRGRVYGIVSAVAMIGGALVMLGIGKWLDVSSSSYSLYLPLAAGLQLVAALLLGVLARYSGAERPGTPQDSRTLLQHVIEPISHMREVLAGDRVFARYEAAFMTYGIGWMVCYALVPLLVTDKLKLSYDQIAGSTHMTFLISSTIMTVPAGWLMDKLGPSKMACLSFGIYFAYPILLMLATNPTQLSFASAIYGIAAAGVSVCWMLGPVNLAPSPDKVPQYVAIHATLVGLRGAVFQFFGVWLYTATGSFYAPLTLAAAGFGWAAWQMWRLGPMMGMRGRLKKA